MTIMLVGASGTGKAMVGTELADLLGKSFIDVDARVEGVVGKPVTKIFTDDGEARFRALEKSTALELLETREIVSLGEEAVMDPRIRETLAGYGVIRLEVSIRQASRRVGLNTVRPLSLGNIRGKLIGLLQEHTPVYKAVSTTRVNTNRSNPRRIVARFTEAGRRP